MSFVYKVMTVENIDEIIQLEKSKIKDQFSSEADFDISTWTAKWRKESLEYYAQSGWSYISFEQTDVESKIAGYFLAQPLLFFESQTQSLWVEYISYNSLQVRDELCELAYKLSREKHFQRVYFKNENSVGNALKKFSSQTWHSDTFYISTTKAQQ
jgi:hypothetical protein